MSVTRSGKVSVQWIAWTLVAGVAVASGWGLIAAEPRDEAAAIQQAKNLSTAFRAAARNVVPTVVEIRTETKSRSENGSDGSAPENPFKGTPFEDFFGDQMPGFRWKMVPDEPQTGLGSGVIIDPSGVVLTNNHVVEDADKVIVRMGDGREYQASDIKTDPRSDLAVLRIKPDGSLPAARLGNSDALEIGDWVLAIGNPFALEQTVSAGIISGKGRSVGMVGRGNFLQTDAAINPGNSGGPLVNLDGEVVGINTAIFSRSGGFQGIGFAIPVNVAKWVTPQLIKEGTVKRGYLGVQLAPITGEIAEQLGVKPHQGVVIRSAEDGGRAVSPGSPAEKAGLRDNDVIVRYDGEPVTGASDLQKLVEESSDGSQHRLDIIRQGKPTTVNVVIQSMPTDFGVASFQPEGKEGEEEGPVGLFQSRALGLTVTDLSEEYAEQLGLKDTAGVVVFSVNRDGPAYRAGIRQGVVVVSVGGKPVKDVRQFRAALADQSLEKGISLELRTGRGSQKVTIRSS